ncbi:MAG: hypothetical protein WEB30_07075 [Cyclobacteriaceae bacterium]
MLGAIGQLMESEYTNPAELLGLNGEVDTELLGYLNKLNPIQRMKAVNKMTKKHIPSQGSRAEFEKFFVELPKHIKEQLLQGKLRLADHLIYTIKPVNGAKTIKMFESQDVKEVSLRNISNAKLPKNMALLVSGIYLLQGKATTLAVDDVKITTFSTIETVGALANGEFKLKANKKQLVSDTSNRNFVTNNFNMVPQGFYKLANPRLIHDDVDIEFEIELGTVNGLDANTVIYVGLAGTATIP